VIEAAGSGFADPYPRLTVPIVRLSTQDPWPAGQVTRTGSTEAALLVSASRSACNTTVVLRQVESVFDHTFDGGERCRTRSGVAAAYRSGGSVSRVCQLGTSGPLPVEAEPGAWLPYGSAGLTAM